MSLKPAVRVISTVSFVVAVVFIVSQCRGRRILTDGKIATLEMMGPLTAEPFMEGPSNDGRRVYLALSNKGRLAVDLQTGTLIRFTPQSGKSKGAWMCSGLPKQALPAGCELLTR